MKSSKFGVEIEFYNMTKKNAALILSKYFGNKIISTSSYKFKVKDSSGRYWTITTDRSLHNSVDEPKPYKQQYCGEFITPILTYQDMKTLLDIAELLNKGGAKSDGEHGCSVHVHVDESGLTTKDLCDLCKQHNKIYKDIAKCFHLTRTQKTVYAKILPDKFISSLTDNITRQQLRERWYRYVDVLSRNPDSHYNKSRYSVFNLHSMFEGHGVELRYFKFFTNIDTKLLENIINYSLMITKQRNTLYTSINDLLDAINSEQELQIDKDILLHQKILKIKKATAEDLDELYKLYEDRVEWFKTKRIKQWSTFTKSHPKEDFKSLIKDGVIYKAVIGNELVGAFEFSTKSRSWHSTDKALYLWGVVTKVGTRDIGDQIVSYCEDVCRGKGIQRLRGFYLKNNKKLADIYKDCGFKIDRTYKIDSIEFSLIEKMI